MDDVRLIQVFIAFRGGSPGPGVFEVSADKQSNLFCTCPGFASKGNCKHAKLVKERLDHNGGKYPFEFITEIKPEELKEAIKDRDKFHKFIIDNARIEAL